MHMRSTKHFSLWSSPLVPQRKEKKIQLFTWESSQQAKEEREIFLGFVLITITSIEIKLTNFFGFFKVYPTHKKKARKRT